ncbi:hypothetical protein BKA57DRAFT_477455 [Linnemannia elongata]|nr:hypothetical protein BKA57DRAFT_477455 [Linnemannia elongata]
MYFHRSSLSTHLCPLYVFKRCAYFPFQFAFVPLFLVRTLPMHVPCSFPLIAQSLLSSFFATHPWIRSYALCFCSCPFPFATHALVPSYTPFPLHMHCGYLFHRCQRPSTFPCPFMLLMRCAYSFYFLAFSTRSSHIPKPILSVHALRIFVLFPIRSNHTHITLFFFHCACTGSYICPYSLCMRIVNSFPLIVSSTSTTWHGSLC